MLRGVCTSRPPEVKVALMGLKCGVRNSLMISDTEVSPGAEYCQGVCVSPRSYLRYQPAT